MKKVFSIAVMIFLFPFFAQAMTIVNVQQAVDVAGKQRMLTQRMLADYVMMGMNSNFKDPRTDLIRVVKEFNENLEAVSRYDQSRGVKLKISKVQALWATARKSLKKQPTMQNCDTLWIEMDTLLTYCNDIVVAIKKSAKNQLGEIVDLSGRQRMLSQRIAGLYILNLWAQDRSVYQEKLDEAMSLFGHSMNRLKQYGKNTEEINALITRVETSYHYLEKMNSLESSMQTMPSLVYQKLDDILITMDKITHLYASAK